MFQAASGNHQPGPGSQPLAAQVVLTSRAPALLMRSPDRLQCFILTSRLARAEHIQTCTASLSSLGLPISTVLMPLLHRAIVAARPVGPQDPTRPRLPTKFGTTRDDSGPAPPPYDQSTFARPDAPPPVPLSRPPPLDNSARRGRCN